MHRLFVALRPPADMRALLLACMGGVPGARWQDDDQLHLTLRFVGEVERPVAEEIAIALGRVDGPRPTIALTGSGVFARRDVPHTLWAGVAPNDALARLQARIERALVRIGLTPEPRAFHPHVTLARLNRASGPTAAFLAETGGLRSPPATLDAFLLYESQLGRDGAHYEPVARYPLD